VGDREQRRPSDGDQEGLPQAGGQHSGEGDGGPSEEVAGGDEGDAEEPSSR
jgi:hypothetical protein